MGVVHCVRLQTKNDRSITEKKEERERKKRLSENWQRKEKKVIARRRSWLNLSERFKQKWRENKLSFLEKRALSLSCLAWTNKKSFLSIFVCRVKFDWACWWERKPEKKRERDRKWLMSDDQKRKRKQMQKKKEKKE